MPNKHLHDAGDLGEALRDWVLQLEPDHYKDAWGDPEYAVALYNALNDRFEAIERRLSKIEQALHLHTTEMTVVPIRRDQKHYFIYVDDKLIGDPDGYDGRFIADGKAREILKGQVDVSFEIRDEAGNVVDRPNTSVPF